MTGNVYEENETGDGMPDMISNKFFGTPEMETENFILQKDLSVILKTEIEKLSPVYKMMITLYHKEELSYDEIGQITGMPSGTVKSYLFRARKTLKDSLLLNFKKEDLC